MLRSQESIMQTQNCKLWWRYGDGGEEDGGGGSEMMVEVTVVVVGHGRATNGQAARSCLTATAACCI